MTQTQQHRSDVKSGRDGTSTRQKDHAREQTQAKPSQDADEAAGRGRVDNDRQADSGPIEREVKTQQDRQDGSITAEDRTLLDSSRPHAAP